MSEETSKAPSSSAPLILGVSGLRGIVGESLTPEVVVRYAAAFGEWLKERCGVVHPHLVIGRDGRAGGEAVYQAAISGLLGVGCRVHSLGVATTPTVGCYLTKQDLLGDGAIVVTASHNPAEWNGLKCLVKDCLLEDDGEIRIISRAPSAEEANEIIGRFEEKPVYTGSTMSGVLESRDDGVYYHQCKLVAAQMGLYLRHGNGSEDDRPWRPIRSVLDAVNCSGSTIAVPHLEKEGEVVCLNCTDSGIFPHTPEPTKENLSGEGGLCDAVPGLKADIGFAQDPDADRLAIVDEKGEYIGEEYTLVLCAMALLEARGTESKDTPHPNPLPGGEREPEMKPVLVTNLSTSRMIEDVAAKYGAVVERTPVGEANVVQRMKELAEAGRDVVLGGEGNGGVIWPQVVYVRDSLSGMALVLALMARTGKTVSELVTEIEAMSPGGKGYCIVKKKVDIASKADAEPAVRAVSGWAKGIAGARIDLQDGVRVDFDEGGKGGWGGSWVHVRASNTEAIMRLICEAPSEAITAEVLAAVERAIASGSR